MKLDELYKLINDSLRGSFVKSEDVKIEIKSDGRQQVFASLEKVVIAKTPEELKESPGMYPGKSKATLTLSFTTDPSEIDPEK